MRLIGLDAGTTSVSGVLLNAETGDVEKVVTGEHHASIPSNSPGTDIQDPERIYHALENAKRALLDAARGNTDAEGRAGDVIGISVTGQVHGVLYFDATGRHVSPLYTWQDSRGREPVGNEASSRTWSDWASAETGYWLPPGYGFLTHMINRKEGVVPDRAVGMTTLLGYLSMRLVDVDRPLLEPTDAHSMGIYDLSKTAFDTDALRRLGVEDQFIPEIAPAGTTIGNTVEGIPVFVSVGDNQAGFVGSVRTCADSLLVSVGTSAQLSAFTPSLPETPDDGPPFPGWVGALETRPYPGGGFLLSGASIAGGSAYRMLETLFRTICQTYGAGDPGPILDKMNSINSAELHEHQRLTVSTQFLGTRRDPAKRGSITGIAPSNFTPEYLVDGFVRGIVAEVAGFYEDFRESTGHCSSATIGVGNALRRNALLRSILHTELNLPLFLPAQREETALGAAIIAGVGAGVFDSYTSPDRPLRYEGEADHVSM